MKIPPHLQKYLTHYLEEDMPWGDVTTHDMGITGHQSQFEIVNKSPEGVVCGLEIASFLLKDVTQDLTFECQDGDCIQQNQVVLSGKGETASLLSRERLLLNILMRLSGISTQTRRMVDRVEGFDIQICATRKTTPGFGFFEKYAVEVGGGLSHRMGLSDGYLVKNNHIAACGGVREALTRLHKRKHHLALEIEVRDIYEFKQAIEFKPDIILCDHFSHEDLQTAIGLVSGSHIKLEVSGNITLQNIKNVALHGIDFVSSGALTHSSASLDFSLWLKNSNATT
jgi:nicotinate-nucleotide pyrophosphorylase (carboxylating)